jgi:uncharacterized protein Yka (UPF0111/DUF47 family)
MSGEVKRPKLLELMKTKKLGEILSSQKYSEIVKRSEKWTDDVFPPVMESIFNGKTELSGFSLLLKEQVQDQAKVS